MAERGSEIGRADEDAVDAVDAHKAKPNFSIRRQRTIVGLSEANVKPFSKGRHISQALCHQGATLAQIKLEENGDETANMATNRCAGLFFARRRCGRHGRIVSATVLFSIVKEPLRINQMSATRY